MSLTTGLQLPVEQKLAGIVVMSGYLPGAKKFRFVPGLEDTPILHCHGDSDPMVCCSNLMFVVIESGSTFVG